VRRPASSRTATGSTATSFAVPPEELGDEGHELPPLRELELADLMDALREVLKRLPEEKAHEILASAWRSAREFSPCSNGCAPATWCSRSSSPRAPHVAR